MKKKYIFALIFVFLCPLFAIFGCTPMFKENAICKIGNKSFGTLSEAIEFCQGGETIEVYNSILQDKSNKFVTHSANGKDYVQYLIDKNLTIKGIKQNSKKPTIFGSILIDTDSSVSLQNLEIVNDYVSFENDLLNAPYTSAIFVKDGGVEIKNCDIHKSQSVDNQTVTQNNLSLLSGILISRGNKNLGKALDYIIENNTISGYDNFDNNHSSFAIAFSSAGGVSLEPFSVNYLQNKNFDYVLQQNKITQDNLTFLQVQFGEKYEYLSTSFEKLIVPQNFDKNSVVVFNGDLFGPQQDCLEFDVYGKMTFKAVQNVHFFLKNASAKVNRDISRDKNVQVSVYKDLPF